MSLKETTSLFFKNLENDLSIVPAVGIQTDINRTDKFQEKKNLNRKMSQNQTTAVINMENVSLNCCYITWKEIICCAFDRKEVCKQDSK